MDVNGKVAVVTGGASGIGQAVARRIAGAGGKVVIFDLNEEAGNAMVAELGADHCVFANVNVVDEASELFTKLNVNGQTQRIYRFYIVIKAGCSTSSTNNRSFHFCCCFNCFSL